MEENESFCKIVFLQNRSQKDFSVRNMDPDELKGESPSILRDQLRIDPEILRHQEEWSELYSHTMKSILESDEQLHYRDESFDDRAYLLQTLRWISYDDRKLLQNIWITSAVHGKAIYYPKNKIELWFYWLSESSLYVNCIDISVLAIVTLSLLESKQCFTSSYSSTNDSTSFSISSLIFLNTFLQFFDLFLFIRTNHWSERKQIRNLIRQDHTLIWQMIRAISLLVLAVNCIMRFKYPTIPNFSQMLIPFLVLPRREDLKQLASGILSAIIELRKIFQLWGLFILLWAFLGFCLLRRYNDSSADDTNPDTTDHFSTYFKALYVCFHCVLSRPTVLYRLKPIFSQNNFTAFYFVFLTIFGDILISALVIAMGTRAFRQFSRQNLNGRLCYRHRALLSLFSLYSSEIEINSYDTSELQNETNINHGDRQRTGSVEEGGQGMSFIQWYNFCVELPHDFQFLNEKDIRILFLTEDKQDTGIIKELSFFRLCAIVTRKLIFFTSSLHARLDISRATEQTRVASFKNDNVVRKYLQDVALQNQFGNNEIDHSLLLKSLSEQSKRSTEGAKENSTNGGNDKFTSSEVKSKLNRFTLGFFPRSTTMNTHSMDRLYSGSHFHKTRSTDIYYFRDSITTFLTNNSKIGPLYKWLRKSFFRLYYFHFIIHNPFYQKSAVLSHTTSIPFRSGGDAKSELNQMDSNAEKLDDYASQEVSNDSTFFSPFLIFNQPQWRMSAFLSFQAFINILLVIQTTTLSAKTKTVAAIVLGWLLFFLYIFESTVLTVVYKRTKLEFKIMWSVNLFHFLLYCLLGSDVDNLNQTILTLIIILQSMRFIQCITNFIIFRSFLKIMPVLQRAVVFYSMILYCFAWIGHTTLCGLMDGSDVMNTDDDSHGWGTFSHILNFNTIFSSYYTVAIAAILSNWSMIMDAALASNKQEFVVNWIYFYFFSFRFIAVLILLPLLMSCVIQTYMQYFTRQAASSVKKETDIETSLNTGGKTRSSYTEKLSLDYYHLSIKYKETDEIAALWSSDGKAKVAVVKTNYNGKYGVVIEDLFNQEVIDSLDHQISNTKDLIFEYYHKDFKHFQKSKVIEKVLHEYQNFYPLEEKTNYNPLQKTKIDSSTENFSPVKPPQTPMESIYREHLFRNRDVMLFQVNNAMIIRKQIKWMKDYHDFEKVAKLQNYKYVDYQLLRKSRGLLSEQQVGQLSAVWFEDAIQGFSLIYPNNSFSLLCLRILHSYRFTLILYIFSILQMLAVFLIIPQCFISGQTSQGSGSSIISLKALGIFDACCVVVYVLDIILDCIASWSTYRTYRWLELNGKSWLLLRCVFVGFILLKSVFSIADADSLFNNLRVVRIFFPVLVISRSSNFADILYGIFLSVIETKPVYILFIFFLFIFTFSGFWLLQRFETNAERFANIFHSALSILQCSTSAPFSLFVLLPYYDVSEITPIFFLFLSYAAEILCINLIIGTGNVFFNHYGEKILTTSKEKQFNSFLAIFFLLSDAREEFITFKSFLSFCAHLPSRYFITSYEQDPKTFEENLFSLLFYVKKDVLLLNDKIQLSSIHSKGKPYSLEEVYLQWKISREEFVQLLFIIFNGIGCELVSHQQKRPTSLHINKLFSNLQEEASSTTKAGNILNRIKGIFTKLEDENAQKEKSKQNDVPEKYEEAIELADMTAHNQSTKSPDAEVSLSNSQKELSANVSSEFDNQNQLDERQVATLQISDKHNLFKNEIPVTICEISIKNEETSYLTISFFQTYLCCGFMKIHREYFMLIISWCQYLTFQQMILSKLQPISILDVISFILHFFLLVQLIYFSSITMSNESWLIFGYFLEIGFWWEMFIRIIALGELRYFNDSVQVIRALINLFTFIFMVLMGSAFANTTNGYYLLVVTLQCLRLFLFCTRVRGNGRYRLAIKNTSRALSLFLLILYFWTIIAQEVFCGVLSDDTVTGSTTTDDDATNWNQFSHILNFNNYQQALFTLFEVTVLGSWSMVMDATAREFSPSVVPLIFFFTFRLLMTLVILPMLMSFMVRSFIALYDQIAFVRKHKRQMLKLYRERNLTLTAQSSQMLDLSKRDGSVSVDNGDRNFYNPMGQLQAHNSNSEDHEDDEEGDNNDDPSALPSPQPAPNLDNQPPSKSIIQTISRWFAGKQRFAWFHFRPPTQTKFFSSFPSVELWDMLALKEADDNALYHPMENQILLNLENYRLQLQYYSYLLYLKFKEYKSSSQESGQKKEDNDEPEGVDDEDISFNYFSSFSLEKLKDPVEESLCIIGEPENEKIGHNSESEEEVSFAESLFEKRISISASKVELTIQEKREKQERSEVKKRLSHLMQAIKSTSELRPISFTNSLTSDRTSPKDAQKERDELTEYFEQVETLLQINHSLNQVIHNVFIDLHKDYQQLVLNYQQKKLSRNSLAARFSLFLQEEE